MAYLLRHFIDIEDNLEEIASDFAAEFNGQVVRHANDRIEVKVSIRAVETSFLFRNKGTSHFYTSAEVDDNTPLSILRFISHHPVMGIEFSSWSNSRRIDQGTCSIYVTPCDGKVQIFNLECTHKERRLAHAYLTQGIRVWCGLDNRVHWEGNQDEFPSLKFTPCAYSESVSAYRAAMIAAGHTPIDDDRWL